MTDNDKLIELYHKMAKPKPSTALDAKVLETAQKRLLKGKKQSSNKIIWAFSSVAMLMLSVSVVVQLAPQNTPTPYGLSSPPKEMMQSAEIADESARFETTVSPAPMLKREIVAEQTQQTMAKRSLKPKMAAAPSALSTPMMADSMMNTPQKLPIFPFNLAQLLTLDGSLSGHQSDNFIAIFRGHEQVLKLEALENKHLKVTAYPLARVLGVQINWDNPPINPTSCSTKGALKHCKLSDVLTGSFRSNRLMYVYWVQK